MVVQNSVPVARMGSATTSQQFVRQIGAALGISAFVLAATVGGFRMGLPVMIAVSAGTFACILALPAHSLHNTQKLDARAVRIPEEHRAHYRRRGRSYKENSGVKKSTLKKRDLRPNRRSSDSLSVMLYMEQSDVLVTSALPDSQ